LLGGGTAPIPPQALVVPSEVLVLMRASGDVSGVFGSAGEPGAEGEILDRARHAGVRVRELKSLVPLGAGRAAGGTREGLAARAWVLRYAGNEAPSRVAARLLEDAAVEYAGPNHLIPVDAAAAPARAADAPDDSLYAKQVALTALNVPQAWSRTPGAAY
jgi:hypothetical protein